MSDMMDNLQNPVLRGRVLRLCSLADQTGIGNDVTKNALLQYGFDVGEKEVLSIFSYLSGKGLIKVEIYDNKILNFKRHIAFILPEGIDVLEGRKVVEGVEL